MPAQHARDRQGHSGLGNPRQQGGLARMRRVMLDLRWFRPSKNEASPEHGRDLRRRRRHVVDEHAADGHRWHQVLALSGAQAKFLPRTEPRLRPRLEGVVREPLCDPDHRKPEPGPLEPSGGLGASRSYLYEALAHRQVDV
eukprot:179058-Pyramimonas_sp.AAC.1